MQPQPLKHVVVDSVQNKELLWTTLQESGAFSGLTQDQFQPVQSAFDRTVQQAAKSMSGSSSLSDVNKQIIREFMQSLRSLPPPPPEAPKKKKIEMVYRADDLKTERANEFERQLREKQTEMESFLTLKKPSDVNFADSSIDTDKPIGDEMSRLIAQELAARERELVQLKPEDIKKAQQWIGTDNNATNVAALPNVVKKSVSFSNMKNVVEEEHEVEQFEFEHNDANDANDANDTNESFGNPFEETESILSKFKRIGPIALESQSQSITMQQLYNKLIELEQRVNANHAEIMACFKQM